MYEENEDSIRNYFCVPLSMVLKSLQVSLGKQLHLIVLLVPLPNAHMYCTKCWNILEHDSLNINRELPSSTLDLRLNVASAMYICNFPELHLHSLTILLGSLAIDFGSHRVDLVRVRSTFAREYKCIKN